MPQLKAELIESILTGSFLPAQPSILLAIEEELRKEQPNFDYVTQLLSGDVTLSAGVLAIANDKRYNYIKHNANKKYMTIDGAINALGIEKVRKLVDSIALRDAMKLDKTPHFDRFWDSAADVAILAEQIAKKLIYPDINEAYLVGMYRDVGIPLMMQAVDGYKEFLAKVDHEHADIIQKENEQYGINHRLVGFSVTRHWHLPERVSHAILLYDQIESPDKLSSENEVKVHLLNSIVHVAEVIDEYFRSAARTGHFNYSWERIPTVILEHLGVSEDDLIELRDDIFAITEHLLQSHAR